MTLYHKQMLYYTRALLSAIESGSLRDAGSAIDGMRAAIEAEDNHRARLAELGSDFEPLPPARLYGINEDRTLGELAPDAWGFGEEPSS